MNKRVLVISNRVVGDNSKVDFPDLNFPGKNETILRYLHKINYEDMTVQMDGEDGPWFTQDTLPQTSGFFERVTKV
jgi:hypothetical protein